MSNPNAGRSSCRDPQVQQEVRNLVPQDVFKGNLSEYNLVNITRLSGNTGRGSNVKRTGSGIPTPSNTRVPPGKSSSSKLTNTATGSNLASHSRARPTTEAAGSSSRSRSVSSTRNNNPPSHIPKKSQMFRNTSIAAGLNNTRRKSQSYESLSFLQTPRFTPARSCSKSPSALSTTRRRGVHNEINDFEKTIIITKDKKKLTEMALLVFKFLEQQDCKARPIDYKDFINPAKMQTTSFFSMIKFLASHFVGDSYFGKDKSDEEAKKIIEMMKLLKYPGTVSPSHLKTPTVQHAWPSCFAFLTWLCCRTQYLLTPPPERSNISELANNGLQEIAFESYLTLFPLHFRDELTREDIVAEIENFTERVRYSYGVELLKTKEELIQEMDLKRDELERIQQEEDPCKETTEKIEAAKLVTESLVEKIQETEKKCKNYSDLNPFKLQEETLQVEITGKKTKLARLKQQVKTQPFSRQEASSMVNETAALKNQLDSIRHVNTTLQQEVDARRQKLNTREKEFYDLCKKFNLVECYNDHVRFLKLDEYLITPNPFGPKELEDWMKEVSKTLRRCQVRVNEMVKEVALSSDQKEKENQEHVNRINMLKKEMEDWNLKLKSAHSYKDFLERENEEKIAAAQNLLDNANHELTQQEDELSQLILESEKSDKNFNGWKERFVEYTQTADEWKHKAEEELRNFSKYKAELKQIIQDAITEQALIQQAFYQENFSVDIFAEPNLDSTGGTHGKNNGS